jgi:sugar (pentulose or hexulose) kinase
MQYVIRVDIGLQSLRTALFSAEGNFAAKAIASFTISSQPQTTYCFENPDPNR